MSSAIFLLPILFSFLLTLLLLPPWIRHARKVGLVGIDMQKISKSPVTEAGGVPLIAGFVVGVLLYISLRNFYLKTSDSVVEIFVLLCVILIVAFIGVIDDLLGWKKGLSRKLRVALVSFAAIPLMVIGAGRSVIALPFIGQVDLGLMYPFIIIPLGVIGASTTFNFLAGFNGLEARQGILLLGSLAIATWFTGSGWLTVILLCMCACLAAFLLFNSNPAQVFPGNITTYAIGALLATTAILGDLEKFAVFIFIPNIVEVFLKLRGRLQKESFGKPLKDGTLDLRYDKIYGLTHLSMYLLKRFRGKATESEVVGLINFMQLIFIILGFIIFREGIFI